MADAKAAVRLIAMADKDAVLAISGKLTLPEALTQYEQDFSRNDVYFSYENVIVTRKEGLVVGCILYFRGADEERYAAHESQGGNFPRESDDDEIYIDSLAVDPDHQGCGIAKQLVRAVIKEAAAQGFAKVGLLADVAKPHLGKLYRSLGFAETKRMRYLNDEYEKLVYDVTQAIPIQEKTK
ncbi:MAG: GNAT family N-acetyltransferase [Ottowia sp.]|uniref:GNAT family N-acetyltransferase n=1 Tax=Ottowia sp. TaxID=1898956 RepID=UPI003C793E9C